jgi:hypothetical protein
LKGGNSRDQDAWFILLCAALALEKNLGDFEPQLIEPTYIEALRLPGDANPNAFDACVTALCDFHLNQWNENAGPIWPHLGGFRWSDLAPP